MSFNLAARTLLKTVPQTQVSNTELAKNDRGAIMAKLDSAGFSLEDTFRDLRELYDSTEEDTVKRGILTDILKVRGLMTIESSAREIPNIVINVVGDNTRVNAMLCPPAPLYDTTVNEDKVINASAE